MIRVIIRKKPPSPAGASRRAIVKCLGTANALATRGLFCAAVLAAMALVVPLFSPLRADSRVPTPDGYTRTEFLATNLLRIPFQTQEETLRWMEARKRVQTRAVA